MPARIFRPTAGEMRGQGFPACWLCSLALLWVLVSHMGNFCSHELLAAERQSFANAKDAKLLEKLKRELDWNVEQVPLRDVVESVRKQYDVNVWVDIKALNEVGVDEDAPLTFHGKRVSAEIALDRLLEPLQLAWTVEDSLLIITSPESAETRLSVRVYNVRDLLAKNLDSRGWTAYDFDSLIELITGSVAPNTWDSVGGPGSVKEYTNDFEVALVISQTHDVHREIDELFSTLRHLPLGGQNSRHETSRSGASSSSAPRRRTVLAPAWPPVSNAE